MHDLSAKVNALPLEAHIRLKDVLDDLGDYNEYDIRSEIKQAFLAGYEARK
jgi:hypothetical protein